METNYIFVVTLYKMRPLLTDAYVEKQCKKELFTTVDNRRKRLQKRMMPTFIDAKHPNVMYDLSPQLGVMADNTLFAMERLLRKEQLEQIMRDLEKAEAEGREVDDTIEKLKFDAETLDEEEFSLNNIPPTEFDEKTGFYDIQPRTPMRETQSGFARDSPMAELQNIVSSASPGGATPVRPTVSFGSPARTAQARARANQ